MPTETLEEFDFDFQPSIDPKIIYDLAELDFVRNGNPVLLLGRPGCGKSHLGVALGIKAVEAGYRGYFTGATDMTKALVSAWPRGTSPARSARTPRPASWSSTTWASRRSTARRPTPSSRWSTGATSCARPPS